MAKKHSSSVQVGKIHLIQRGERWSARWYDSAQKKPVTVALGVTKLSAALEEAERMNADLTAGRVPTVHRQARAVSAGDARPSQPAQFEAPAAAPLTVSQLMDALEKNREAADCKPSYLDWLKMHRKHVEREVGAMDITAVDRPLCQRVIAARKSTMRRGLIQYMRSLFNLALHDGIIFRSPMLGIRNRKACTALPIPYRGAKRVAQYLTQDQVAFYHKLYRRTPIELPFLIGCYAGLRITEILTLRWDDIDLANRTITVNIQEEWSPKNRRPRTVPIDDVLHAALSAVKGRSGLACPSPGGGKWPVGGPWDRFCVSQAMNRICEKASKNADLKKEFGRLVLHRGEAIEADPAPAEKDDAGVPIIAPGCHVWRHTFGVSCAMSGISIFEIQAYMGHSVITTTNIYAHYDPGRNHKKFSLTALRKPELPKQQDAAG